MRIGWVLVYRKLRRGIALIVPAVMLAGCVVASPRVPGDSTANPVLQRYVSDTIFSMDRSSSDGCTERAIVDTQITEVRADGHSTAERWVLDRCGQQIAYDVTYNSASRTGLAYGVRRE